VQSTHECRLNSPAIGVPAAWPISLRQAKSLRPAPERRGWFIGYRWARRAWRARGSRRVFTTSLCAAAKAMRRF